VNGTASASGACAKQAARAGVSMFDLVCHSLADVFPALYAADQKAHEEAVQNGGVRNGRWAASFCVGYD
jgi:hypothetical protein